MSEAVVEQIAGLTPKGRRTRQRLLDGARRAFEKKANYVETKISDITKEAGVAYGTLYTYFDSKEELFREMAVGVILEAYEASASTYRGPDPILRIESANRNFMERYVRNASITAVIEQAAALYPEYRDLRRELREPFVERIKGNIERMQSDGVADPTIDAGTAAHALVSMTDNFHYVWLVLGQPFEQEVALRTLTQLWVGALGIERPTPSS